MSRRIIDPLIGHMNDLQKHVIGLFRTPYPNSPIQMVLEADEVMVVAIHIGDLGGVTTDHIPVSMGKLHLFEPGQTLYTLKTNMTLINEICSELRKSKSISPYIAPGL